MVLKNDNKGLTKSSMYIRNYGLFYNHYVYISNFSKQFDPSDHITKISENQEYCTALRSLSNQKRNMNYVMNELWPKLGFLPVDARNPTTSLIGEYFLNELILKDPASHSLEQLELS